MAYAVCSRIGATAADPCIIEVNDDETRTYLEVPVDGRLRLMGSAGSRVALVEILKVHRGPYTQLRDAQAALLVALGISTDIATANQHLDRLAVRRHALPNTAV